MTDARLLRVRFHWPPSLDARPLLAALASTLDAQPLRATREATLAEPHACATGWMLARATIDAVGCAWLHGARQAIPAALRVQQALNDVVNGVEVAELHAELALRGAAAGSPAPFRYAVETDVAAEHEADFNAWYDREHLPGLAAVPGTVRAARYRDPDGHPRYLALYDLEREDVLGSAPWLAVRGTAWSSRVRPAFRNTRRTMLRRA